MAPNTNLFPIEIDIPQGGRILSGKKKRNRPDTQDGNDQLNLGNVEARNNPVEHLELRGLEDRIRSDIENIFQFEITKLQEVVKRLSEQFTNINLSSIREPVWPRDSLPSNFNLPNIGANVHNSSTPSVYQNRILPGVESQRNNIRNTSTLSGSRLSSSFLANTGKIANLISNWNVTFSGSFTGLPVEKFIYIVTSLTNDNLGGDFKLVCEHSHILFTSKAKEWYWSYCRLVDRIQWEPLCKALKTHFNGHNRIDEGKEARCQ